MQPWFIVSTVGTSLLTNYARERAPEMQSLLRRTANMRDQELTGGELATISSLEDAVRAGLAAPETETAGTLSAEINGIVTYYGERLYDPKRLARDEHVLVATDTYQGEVAAKLVQEWLQGRGFSSVQVFQLPGLSTRNQQAFATGVGALIKWTGETLPGYRESGSRVVFNLVGGFKSLQGYMNTLGMLYADEIIYIFEGTQSGLIRIPRLPVNLADFQCLREHATQLALLEQHEVATKQSVVGIPEALLDYDEHGNCTFSTWGASIWAANKGEILGDAGLLGFPHLDYSERFERDFASLREKKVRAKVLSTLAKVSVVFAGGRVDRLRADGGLQYEDLKQRPGIGHFRVDREWRITCEVLGRALRLRRLGGHEILKDP